MNTTTTPKPIIIARDVDKHFGAFQALRQVSATFIEGQVTAIVGPSSSGKTTLCFAVQRAEDLLRKVERVVFALLVGQARIRSKIFQRQGIFLCQRAGGS